MSNSLGLRSLAVALIASSVVVACGESSETQAEAGQSRDASRSGERSCDELAASAASEVSDAIEANLTCTVDADCTETWLSGQCFDHCGRVVNVGGRAAVSDARARVNAAQCAEFSARGCKSISPPCEPPTPPVCSQGRCT